jgi:hypothetical protein
MESLLDLYLKLLLLPPVVGSVVEYLINTIALSVPLFALVYALAVVARAIGRTNDDKRQLGAMVEVRFAWAWANAAAAGLLLIHLSVLVILERVASWTSITPHATVCLIGCIAGVVFYVELARELRASQNAVFAAQKVQGSRT